MDEAGGGSIYAGLVVFVKVVCANWKPEPHLMLDRRFILVEMDPEGNHGHSHVLCSL